MLSTEAGFDYLSEEGFVEAELERWRLTEYIAYVKKLEEQLEKALIKGTWRKKDKQYALPGTKLLLDVIIFSWHNTTGRA